LGAGSNDSNTLFPVDLAFNLAVKVSLNTHELFQRLAGLGKPLKQFLSLGTLITG